MSSLERLSSIASSSPLPLLAERAYFQLERPSAARLLVEQPIGFRDRRRRHQEIRGIEGTRPQRLDPTLAYPFGVDAGIDDEMGDVDVFRTQLARRSLGNGPQTKLRTGEGRITAATAQACRRAGEEDIALAPGQHQARRFAPGKKAGIAGHFPDLSKHPLGGLDDREVDVGANVENAGLERRMLVGVTEEGGDFLLVARIARTAADFTPG